MRSTSSRLLLLLIIGSFLTVYGQKSSKRFDKNRQDGTLIPKSALQLTTSIINQRYCAGNQLMLTLKLQYTNVGNQPLILFKFAKVIYQSMVSRSVRDSEAKRYEQDASISAYSSMDYISVDTPSPGPLFVILKPTESFEDEDIVNVFINDGKSIFNRKFLRPGDYVLEVRTSTWGSSPEQAERLRARWKQYGDFWSWDIKSLPMPFKIDEERKVVNCVERARD